MSKKNPLSHVDKVEKRVAPELESDNISQTDQTELTKQIKAEYSQATTEMAGWITDRIKDLLMYEGAKPTEIEDLDKESWQSDRNLGLTAAICDSYQATLLGTCWTPDTIHMTATESTDIDRKDQSAKFAKWMCSDQECNVFPEIDDFIHNRITMGTSIFKVRWKVWYEWIDRRIPREVKVDGQRAKFLGYKIETEKKRFEKAVLENIDNLDDLLYPTFGKTLQEKPFLIHVLHKRAIDVIDEAERGYYKNIGDPKDFVEKLKQKICDSKIATEKEKKQGLRRDELTTKDLVDFEVDLLERYGKHEADGKFEEYRITYEPLTETVMAKKPLRKITRTGKRPFIGSGLIRRPGLFPGKSIPRLIAPVSNAFNNVWNQKSDFQYVSNVPFGFYKPDESFQQQNFRVRPGDLFPTDDPKSVNFPNLTRSLAWAESDINLLFQMAERLTGAASYFMSNTQGVSGTATRDMLINQKSETRFGLWVKRIQADIAEAITMLFQFYQDWSPSDLGDRVLGEEDGKKLFENFSIETIRGKYNIRLTPDIATGSKTLEREIALWGLESLSQTMWFNPQINPKGSWHLAKNAAEKVGIPNVEMIMPPEPRVDFGSAKVVDQAWTKIKQGEVLSIEEGDDVMTLFMGLSEKKDKDYHTLDKEYRQNFDNYMMQLYVGMIEQVNKAYQEQQANNIAMGQILNEKRGLPPEAPIGGGQPGVPPGMGQPPGGLGKIKGD